MSDDDLDELPITSDNFLVASEVMASAIRILALLDLSDREIAWRLFTLAENECFSKEVDRFAKRVSALRTDQEPEPAEVQKLADLCLGAIPAFARAQRWYREHCAEQGLEFATCRDEWRASASDEMLDHEHEVVFFFDQSPISHELQALQTLADHCERLAMAEPVEQILGAIEQEGLQLPPSPLRSLHQALNVAANYALMLKMLDRLAPGSEMPRTRPNTARPMTA